jgi:hypothetical protein
LLGFEAVAKVPVVAPTRAFVKNDEGHIPAKDRRTGRPREVRSQGDQTEIRTPTVNRHGRSSKTDLAARLSNPSGHPQIRNPPQPIRTPTNQKSPTASCSISRQRLPCGRPTMPVMAQPRSQPIRTPTNQKSPTASCSISRQRLPCGRPMMPIMAQPRSQLVLTDTASTFHCVQRCVRRAFLCGIDDYTGQSFEHRKHWYRTELRSSPPASQPMCSPMR